MEIYINAYVSIGFGNITAKLSLLPIKYESINGI